MSVIVQYGSASQDPCTVFLSFFPQSCGIRIDPLLSRQDRAGIFDPPLLLFEVKGLPQVSLGEAALVCFQVVKYAYSERGDDLLVHCGEAARGAKGEDRHKEIDHELTLVAGVLGWKDLMSNIGKSDACKRRRNGLNGRERALNGRVYGNLSGVRRDEPKRAAASLIEAAILYDHEGVRV